ncbi:MAG TPA: 50S ribosomal protein L11 methyltransferase [Rhizomicrobium sp.]|jgi:ribosomal protein L11 methyltransferase
MMTLAPIWKASIATAKAGAADIVAALEITPPEPQAIVIEEDPFGPDATVEALYAERPDGDFLATLLGREVEVALLPDADWIRLSQEGLPPVRAGRFFVYGAHDHGKVPAGVIPIRIEAGLAFGTGHHETTALCLATLSDLARCRRFGRILDLGCGTGLLAIGAAKLWRRTVMASDIDPIAVSVARENAIANNVGPFVRAVTAEGLENPTLRANGPYDLILANILAGPLTRLAPAISAALTPGGLVVLSGLLRWQEDLVLGFYRAQGLVLRSRRRDAAWSSLLLERPQRQG